MNKSALTPLELLAEYQQQTLITGINKNDFDSTLTTLVILNKEIKNIKIIKSFEESHLKMLAKQFKMKQKSKKDDVLACY